MCYISLVFYVLPNHERIGLDKSELNFCSYFKIDSQSTRIKVKLDFLEIVASFCPLNKSESFGILAKISPSSVGSKLWERPRIIHSADGILLDKIVSKTVKGETT